MMTVWVFLGSTNLELTAREECRWNLTVWRNCQRSGEKREAEEQRKSREKDRRREAEERRRRRGEKETTERRRKRKRRREEEQKRGEVERREGEV